MNLRLIIILFMAATSLYSAADKKLRLYGLFTDNMVFQRDVEVPVWGSSAPDSEITVSFANKSFHTKTNRQGNWELRLPPMKADTRPLVLTVTCKDEKIVLKNILIGEIWICSGQSNMFLPLSRTSDSKTAISTANQPEIRLLRLPPSFGPEKKGLAPGLKWVVCSSGSVQNFSAVGYYFGREIHRELNVPVGLIQAAFGGTKIEAWTPVDTVKQYSPETYQQYLKFLKAMKQDEKAERTRFAMKLRKSKQLQKYFVNGKVRSDKALEILSNRLIKQTPSWVYNHMILPLAPFAVKGFIWYQGEANAGNKLAYCEKQQAMIHCWRKLWHNEAMPFLFVQLPNYRKYNKRPEGGDGFAGIRLAQLKCLRSTPNTGMAVTLDIGDENNLHPPNKLDVGKRLALWALAKYYGFDKLEYSGPLVEKAVWDGKRVVISFSHSKDGLIIGKRSGSKDKLRGFAIQNKSGEWKWADAAPDGSRVVIPARQEPIAVSYACRSNPVYANLYNRAGLPASSFLCPVINNKEKH